MKITTVGHACLLIEANGRKILTDPWWRGPCFGGTWWNWPRPHLDAVQSDEIDYIYISHGHDDHFHRSTLNLLSKRSTVLVSQTTDLAEPLAELGFTVVALGDDDEHDLGNGVTARIMATHSDDTLLVVSDGKEVCINANDALHSAPAAVQDRFFGLLPSPDYLYCGYGVASHFPNCYRLPGKNYVASAARRQHHFNGQWCRIVAGFRPRFAIPFAADVVLLDNDLFWANEPTHNAERPTDLFRQRHPDSDTVVIDAAPGFVMRDGAVESEVLRQPLDEDELRREYAEEIERANQHGRVSDAGFEAALELVRANVETCRAFLQSCSHDYRALIRLHNGSYGIEIAKTGKSIRVSGVDPSDDYDLTYTTRLAYLKWSLTRPYGHEILFVGSGGIFEYRDYTRVMDDLHIELRTVLRRHDKPRPARPPTWRRTISLVLGRTKSGGLYDLETWTVYAPLN